LKSKKIKKEMAHFYGIEVGRNYKFGYTCELCGKAVEKRHNIATKIGQEYNKAMWVYSTPEQEAAMLAQGKAQLSPLCSALTTEWDKGNYPQAIQEASVCPFCKKHQHWDWQFSEKSRELRKGGSMNIAYAIMGIIAGLILALIVLFVVSRFDSTGSTKTIAFFGTWVASSAILALFLIIWLGGDDKKLDTEFEELDGKAKRYPLFIAWEDFWHANRGLIRT
jgi:hypothetical protein